MTPRIWLEWTLALAFTLLLTWASLLLIARGGYWPLLAVALLLELGHFWYGVITRYMTHARITARMRGIGA